MGLINRRGAVFYLLLVSLFLIPNVYAYYDHVVISEVQIDSVIGVGGTEDDWVELYNPTNTDINLNGWSIQKTTGTFTSLYRKRLTGTIPSYGYFLIVRDGTATTQYLKDSADVLASGTSFSLVDDGVVYLVSNNEDIINYNDVDIVDYVGFGTSTIFEGSAIINPEEGKTLERKSGKVHYDLEGNGWDTNNNSNDFFMSTTPNLQNSSNALEKAEHPWFDLITNSSISITEDTASQNAPINLSIYWNDVESGTWTNIAITDNSTDVNCGASGEAIQCSPTNNYTGNFIVNIDADDGTNNAYLNYEVLVDAVNDPPWINGALDNATQSEDFLLLDNLIPKADFDANWSDVEQTTPTTYELITSTNSSTSCYLDASNNLDCSSVANTSGTDLYTFELNDSSQASVRYDWQIIVNTVNDAPWMTDVFSNITLNEDSGIFTTITNSDLNSNWTDVEQTTPTTYELISQSNTTAVSCSFVTNNLQCTTVANQSGINTVKFSLNDSSGASTETDFLITINALNDEPYGYSLNLPINNSNFSTPQILLSINNGTDVENDALTYYLEVWSDSSLTQVSYVNSSISETGTTTNETTSILEEGDYYWRVLAFDGIDNGSWTDVRKFTIDTTPPVFALTQTPEIVYNNESVELNATITDMWTDVDNVILESDFNGSLINYSNGKIKKDGSVYSYIIDSGNFSNKQNVSYRWYANDLVLNENKSELRSFVVQNRPIDILSPILINFEEDTITTINFSSYVDNPDQDVLTYSTAGITPDKVSIEVNDDNLTFTSEGNFSGLINFTLIVTDSYLDQGSIGAAAVILNITPVNDKPWWSVLSITADEDSGLNNSYNLINYAWDVENGSNDLIYGIEEVNVSEVNCSINNKILEFSLASNFTGAASCIISVSDNEDIINNTISFIISNVNDPPWIEGIIPGQVKDEDSDAWILDLTSYERDIDNLDNELIWSVINVNTSLINIQIVNSSDVVIFNTVENASGTNTITFILDDGKLAASQDVLINITAVNDLPTAPSLVNPENNIFIYQDSVILNWTASSDIDNDPVKYYVYFSNNSDPEFKGETIENSLNVINLQNNNIYYWYIIASDLIGNQTKTETRSFNVSLQNEPVINSYYPELDVKIREDSEQEFNVSASDLDTIDLVYIWILNGTQVGTNTNNYTYTDKSIGTHNITVFVSDGLYTISKEWKLTVADKPISDDYSMPELPSDLTNVTGFYVNDEDDGKIDFSGSLDLSDIVDIDNSIKIEKGIIAIDSNKYPQLNKPARITLKGLSYNSIPKIYYNSGFTTNANEINKECDFCNLIRYDEFPTNNGEVVFDVAHFSSFKIGESGEKYNLELFKDLDKCKNDVKGNLNVEIKDPDNNNDFNFGEDIDIKVNVENNNLEDKDVIAEAFLYNIDEDDEEENVESESIDIDKNGDDDFELQMKMSEDYDNKDNYVLFVKAYEEDNEEEQCNYDIIDLNLEREKNEVIIKEVDIIPEEADCNGDIQVNVKVENIGTKDEEELYVLLENSELNVSLESSKFDLDDYKGSDEKITQRFSFKILENIQSKDYNLEASVYFSKGSNSKIGLLKVKSCEGEEKKEDLKLFGETSIAKGIASVHLIITNNNEDIIGDIKIRPIGDWGNEAVYEGISLHPGENNIYLDTKIKEGVTGKYSGLVELNTRDNKAVKANLVFDIKGEEIIVKEEIKKEEEVYRGILYTIVKFVEERLK